jgi:hypothetical protein
MFRMHGAHAEAHRLSGQAVLLARPGRIWGANPVNCLRLADANRPPPLSR